MYVLSWKLLIIGLLLEYFATLLERLELKKLLQNVPYFFNDCTCFLWEGQGHFLEIRIKFHLGRAKERRKRGYGEKPKMRGFFFCKIPNFISQISPHKLLVKLLITTIAISMPKNFKAGTFK